MSKMRNIKWEEDYLGGVILITAVETFGLSVSVSLIEILGETETETDSSICFNGGGKKDINENVATSCLVILDCTILCEGREDKNKLLWKCCRVN